MKNALTRNNSVFNRGLNDWSCDSCRFGVVQYFAPHDHQLAFLKTINGSNRYASNSFAVNLLINFTSLLTFGLLYFHSISGMARYQFITSSALCSSRYSSLGLQVVPRLNFWYLGLALGVGLAAIKSRSWFRFGPRSWSCQCKASVFDSFRKKRKCAETYGIR